MVFCEPSLFWKQMVGNICRLSLTSQFLLSLVNGLFFFNVYSTRFPSRQRKDQQHQDRTNTRHTHSICFLPLDVSFFVEKERERKTQNKTSKCTDGFVRGKRRRGRVVPILVSPPVA